MIASPIPTPPACPTWCTAHSTATWDTVDEYPNGTEATLWCEWSIEVHSVTIGVQRYADWHSSRTDRPVEIEPAGVSIQASGSELSPAEAENIASAIVEAARKSRG